MANLQMGAVSTGGGSQYDLTRGGTQYLTRAGTQNLNGTPRQGMSARQLTHAAARADPLYATAFPQAR